MSRELPASLEQAVILVGGLGTRLGVLTRDTPKPLLQIGDRTFLDYLIENIVRFGFRDILLLAGFRAEQVAAYVDHARRALPSGIRLEVINEPAPIGTAGAIRHAADQLQGRFLLLNGDSYFDFNWLDLVLALHEAAPVVVMSLRRVESTARYGAAVMEGERVKAFAERGDGSAGLINGGVYLVDRRIAASLPDRGSLENDVLPHLCARGLVGGREYEGFFIDIGVPDAFSRAQTEMPVHRLRPAAFFGGDCITKSTSGCAHGPGDIVFSPGAFDAVKRVNDSGYFAFLLNGRADAAGAPFSELAADRFNMQVQQHMRERGAHFDVILLHPERSAGVETSGTAGLDRSGLISRMVSEVLQAWPVRRPGSLFFANDRSYMRVAEAAGVRGIMCTGANLAEVVQLQLRNRIPHG